MIEAEGLTKFYGAMAAIRGVTFEVEKGEVVGFLGPNGAGKSTTMRILTCYMPPSMGTARVDGMDCFERSLEVRGKIGYLPENVPLYADMTVDRFLRFAAEAKAVEGKKLKGEVSRVVDTCGLDKVSHRTIAHLSKGFRQRVGLAQALLNNPSVLVLDEPTIGLDPGQIIGIRKLVKDLREEHTILLSTHILPEVAQICQRVLIINKGRIVATDTPANLTRRLQKSSQVVVQVRDRSSDLAEALQRLDGVETVAAAEDGKNRLVVETDQSRDLRSDIARLVIEMGIDLLELKLMDMSLEDIFMQLVTKEPGQSEEEASR